MKRSKVESQRPRMPPIAEEMKHWSALLREELNRWPQVTSRPMFGMLGFYRKAKIFAALPATRSIGTPNSVIFKITPMPAQLLRRLAADPRAESDRGPGRRWRAFQIRSEEDLRDALWWMNQAYERAR